MARTRIGARSRLGKRRAAPDRTANAIRCAIRGSLSGRLDVCYCVDVTFALADSSAPAKAGEFHDAVTYIRRAFVPWEIEIPGSV